MQVRVLGGIEVLAPDAVALGGPTQRRTLAMLAMHANEVVSLDQLIDATWPNGDLPDRAEHNLRTYVHRLRSSLDGDGERVETVGTGYRLRLDRDQLDATRFEDVVAEARTAASQADTARAESLLDEALGLWGRPYGEFADEEWARAEVTRLGELRASAVEHRFQALLDEGRHTEVVGSLRDAVVDEPWREARRIQLALALYRAGRHAEALRAVQDYRSELAEELGLDPSPEVAELEHRILDHDPTLLPASHQQHQLRGYELDEVIGEGAFSLVWRGEQPSLGRKVAVKQIRAELANQPDFVRRFETEAQTVAALEHPYIVPLYDYWREPDSAYLVMRYVAGGSLESEVLQRGLDDGRLRRLVDQVGAALHTAHRVGVIHRDVKSANVLVDDDGNFFLTDFGIAFTGSAADDELANALSTGSPAYASPEQLRRQELDSRTDVYGFGITLFEAATGRLPFVDAPTQAAIVQRQLEDPVPAPSSVDPSVPRWVDDVVARATAKNPTDRFGSMAELMAAVPPGATAGTDHGRSVAGATVIGELVNPFKALRAFREADAADFHGRDRLVSRFVEVLARPGTAGRLLAVVGPSGSGKSSAVRSGLVPKLRAGAVPGSDDWFITTMLPGARPFEELESALSRVAIRQPGPLVEMMRGDERGIARAVSQILPDEESELLLVIDQFEEMFTHAVDDERSKFLDGLLEAVREPRARLRVAVTIRADFWDRPLRHPGLAARLETAAVTVSPLAADELEAAIVEPVRRQGAQYEPGLVARIIADVGDQPGALPLLQYALTELFDANTAGLIRADSYDAIGGLTGALASRAEITFDELAGAQQAAARRLFGRLVTLGEGTEDTRRRVRLAELADGASDAIGAFGAARLLVFDRDPITRESTVEIAHEALLQAWPRLRGWLDDDRDGIRIHRHLTETAAAWLTSDRDPGELYRGGRLEVATDWAGEHGVDLNVAERRFLDASLATFEAEQAAEREHLEQRERSNRRLRVLITIATVVAVVAGLAGAFALRERNRAEGARSEAQQIAFDRETERLVATAQSLVTTRPREALLLAVAAYQRTESPATIGGLQAVLSQAGPVMGHLGFGTHYLDVESIGSERVVGIRSDGLDLFDVETRQLVDSVAFDVSVPPGAEWLQPRTASAASGLLAVAGAGAMSVFDVADGFVPVFDHPVDGVISSVSVAPGGDRVVVATRDGSIRGLARDGTTLFERQEDLAPNVGAQFRGVVDRQISTPSSIWYGPVPPLPFAVAHEDHVDLMVGVELSRLDWGGATIAGPTLFGIDRDDGSVLPAIITELIDDGSDLLVAGPYAVGRIDPSLSSAFNPLVELTETWGAGRPDAIVHAPLDGELVSILDNGVTARFDETTGDRVSFENLRTGRVEAGTPLESDRQIALATATGIVIVRLDGSGPIWSSVARPAETSHYSLSREGRYLAMGTIGRNGPGFVSARGPDGAYAELDDLRVESSDYMSVPPEPADLLHVRQAVGPTRLLALDGEQPEVFAELFLGPRGSVGDIDAERRWFVSGREAFGFDVEKLPSGPPVPRLESPDPDELATGTRFDPSADRLLLSVASGASHLYETTSWTRLDGVVDGLDIALGYWNSDGSLIATSSSTGQVSIRDGETFELIRHLVGPTGIDNSWGEGALLFSDDDSLLLTNHDRSARLWDVEEGVQIGIDFPTASGTNSGINTGAELQLVTATEDDVRVWNLDVEAWPDVACRTASSNLTRAEWEQWGPQDEPYRAICEAFAVET